MVDLGVWQREHIRLRRRTAMLIASAPLSHSPEMVSPCLRQAPVLLGGHSVDSWSRWKARIDYGGCMAEAGELVSSEKRET